MTIKIDQYLVDHGVSYTVKFIPVSERPNVLNRRINWMVKITRHASQSFDVWQSLHCLPLFNPASSNVEHQIDLIALGTEYQLQVVKFGAKGIHSVERLEKPSSDYILKQLLTDSRILNYRTFKSWANKHNLNFNSRIAKTDYWNYMVNAIKLQSIFNEEEQKELNSILEN